MPKHLNFSGDEKCDGTKIGFTTTKLLPHKFLIKCTFMSGFQKLGHIYPKISRFHGSLYKIFASC